MANIYLRAEAVNLLNTVKDTEDLSTIRGSGLMILDLSKHVETALRTAEGFRSCHRVTHGASQTVFSVSLTDGADMDTLAEHVALELRKQPLLQYATIVVDPFTGEYDEAREALLAKNRWRQLRQARVSIAGAFPGSIEPAKTAEQRRAPWCPVDNVRPAAKLATHVGNDEKRLVSESVAARRKHGFDEKQNFYHEHADWAPQSDTIKKLVAAWHFHQIAEFDGRERAGDPPKNLDGKIALFYVDGNKFGAKQAGKCRTEPGQQQFDELVQGQKKAALKAILKQAWDANVPEQTGPGWWNRTNDDEWRVRLETLLWGGDELLLVVPAWQGWNVARTFFETVRGMQRPTETPRPVTAVAAPARQPAQPKKILNFNAKPSKKQLEQAAREAELAKSLAREAEAQARSAAAERPVDFGPLSYCAGLVFCHAEAPIQRVWQLAKDLAEEAKEVAGRKQTEDEKNLLAYAVLESFDQLGQSVQAARIQHLPFPPTDQAAETAKYLQQTVLHADELGDDQLLTDVRWMKQHFPRGAVYKLLRILRTEVNAGEADSQFRRWFIRATAEIADAETNPRLAAFGGRSGTSERSLSAKQRVRWLHLAELWDYVV